MASQMVQDHVVHFYHLHALDWVDIVSALSANPAATSRLAESISDWPLSSTKYFSAVKDRVQKFVDRGQLGPFANAYWGHPAYRLPPEANLLAVAHYLEALDWQREFIKIHAVLGGKNPHLQSFLVGGMATPIDPDKQASINMTSISTMRELIRKALLFVEKVYIPDLCWPWRRSTRNGPAMALASATSWRTVSILRRMVPTHRCFSHPA